MLIFAAAVFFLIITPGPGVLSTAGVGAAYGGREGSRYILGLFLGNLVVMSAVISGVAGIVLAYAPLRVVLYGLSLAYLMYIAFRIAFAGAKIAFIDKVSPPGVIGGFALQPINPKAYAVNAALFSGFVFMPDAPLLETVVKVVVFNLIWVPIHFVWLWAGVSLRRLDLAPRTQRGINIAMALSMLCVVALAALSPPT
jgi:threonine/homoserine/homoserine lactone efflux protein